MPTTLKNINNRQDALTIFCDYREEDYDERMKMQFLRMFDPQQYLYLEHAGQHMDGKLLFHMLKEKTHNCELILPGSERMVFCHFLRLNDLCENWVDAYQKQVKEFMECYPIHTFLFDQHQIVCLYYESSRPLGEKKEEVIRMLKRLGQEDSFSQEVYFLYASGFDTMDAQENGVVQQLYLLSRADSEVASFAVLHPHWIKMLCYTEYDVNQVERCHEEIEKIDHWMNGEKTRS